MEFYKDHPIIQLVKFSEQYLELSWQWLNDNEIKTLTNTPDFTKEDQKKWYDGIISKEDYLIWGIAYEDIAIGVAGLKNITNIDCEYWGYIGNKKYWGRGLGMQIMIAIERKTKSLGLKSIWLQVLSSNDRAIKLYEKMNYKYEEKINSQLILMRKTL